MSHTAQTKQSRFSTDSAFGKVLSVISLVGTMVIGTTFVLTAILLGFGAIVIGFTTEWTLGVVMVASMGVLFGVLGGVCAVVFRLNLRDFIAR